MKLRHYPIDDTVERLAVPLDDLWVLCPKCLVTFHELSFGAIQHVKGTCTSHGEPTYGLGDSASMITNDSRLRIKMRVTIGPDS